MWSNLPEPLAGSGNRAILWKLIIHQRLGKGKCQRIQSLETWEMTALDFNDSNVPMVGLFSDDQEVFGEEGLKSQCFLCIHEHGL